MYESEVVERFLGESGTFVPFRVIELERCRPEFHEAARARFVRQIGSRTKFEVLLPDNNWRPINYQSRERVLGLANVDCSELRVSIKAGARDRISVERGSPSRP